MIFRLGLRASRARCAFFWLFTAGSAHAQFMRAKGSVPVPSLSAPTLLSHVGEGRAEALLKSSDPEDRQRAFERLGDIGSPRALDLLIKAFEPAGAARFARDRLLAVRALSGHANAPAVRELLVRVMVGVASEPERADAVDSAIESAAALALAASGENDALSALAKALAEPGHMADTARAALLRFPPRDLRPILQNRSPPTGALVGLLSDLADPRARALLRHIVQSAPSALEAAAAFALAKLGDRETLDLARHWLRSETAPDLRLTAVRILLEFSAPDAAPALELLLRDERTRGAALELAENVSLPELSATLLELAAHASGDEESATLALLGLTGTRAAISFLGGALSAQKTSSAAALALALSPSEHADRALSRALRDRGTRRVAVRASVVRKIALGRAANGLNDALAELGKSKDPSDNAVFLWASAVLSPERTRALIERASADGVRAVARAALIPGVAMALAERLAAEPDTSLRDALAAGLVSSAAALQVPTEVLFSLIDARGLAAPLAARALGSRDSKGVRPKILALLADDDRTLRAHAALGLSSSKDGSALGVLEQAYRFETDEGVRLSIVRAISGRSEPARRRSLTLASKLDGSSAVRELAVRALGGAQPTPELSGPQTAWLDFSRSESAQPILAGASVAHETACALVTTAEGLAVPAFADPDGILLVPGLPVGPLSLRLAAPARTDEAPPTNRP